MTLTDRTRLAQELHDGIAQDLVGLGYSIDLILTSPSTPTQTRIDLRKTRFAISELLEKVRFEIHDLHKINHSSIAIQIAAAAEEICEGLKINLAVEELKLASESEIFYQVMRIANELFRNVVAHASASKIEISLSQLGEVATLVITDDGIGGLDLSTNRFGITSCAQRAESIGGEIFWSSSSVGTEVRLVFPAA